MSARHLLFALVIATPAAAEGLVLDEGLLAESARLLEIAQPQSQLAQGRDGERRSAASSSGGSGGSALSGMGIGLQVGTPTALTLKFGAGGGAVVVGLGTGYAYRRGNFGLSVHADYLFTVATLIPDGAVNLSAYLGPGLWLTLFSGGYGYGYGLYYSRDDTLGIGVRFPIGLNARFAAAPIEVYLELDPALFVFPGVDIFLGASLGFRWFF